MTAPERSTEFQKGWQAGYQDGILTADADASEALAVSPEVQALIADAVARGMERAADLCNERGAREEADFGLTRATQNYYRARDVIRAEAAAIRVGHKPGVE